MDFEAEIQRLTFDRDMRNEVRHLVLMAQQAEREACAKIADRCTDDDTRKALGANAVITASQIAAAIRNRNSQ